MYYLFKKIGILSLLILFYLSKTNVAYALSLGELKVYSYLNEPLNAEIIIDGVEDLHISNIIAEIASDKDFARTGIPKSFLLNKLKFEILRTNNITVIHISTLKAVKESFLDFLIQVMWPDGKIIKNYTILLDPASAQTSSRELPLSQQKNNSAMVNKANFSDAIFATSLEDSMEHEISLDQKQQITKIADEVIDRSPPITNEIDLYEAHAKQDNPINGGALNKVASSLQIFAQQPKKTSIDYEKLLDLKPTSNALNKDEIPIAEHLAMSQVNAELAELRKQDPKSNNIVDNVKSIHHEEFSNKHLELIKKYGNDLLLAFFLVSTTIFLFYKIIQQHYNITLEPTNNKKINNNISIEPSKDISQEVLQNISTELPPSSHAPYSIFAKNEELELKLALAKQYIEAGDRKSAKDILEDLNSIIIKEPKYKDKVDALLKCLV